MELDTSEHPHHLNSRLEFSSLLMVSPQPQALGCLKAGYSIKPGCDPAAESRPSERCCLSQRGHMAMAPNCGPLSIEATKKNVLLSTKLFIRMVLNHSCLSTNSQDPWDASQKEKDLLSPKPTQICHPMIAYFSLLNIIK